MKTIFLFCITTIMVAIPKDCYAHSSSLFVVGWQLERGAEEGVHKIDPITCERTIVWRGNAIYVDKQPMTEQLIAVLSRGKQEWSLLLLTTDGTVRTIIEHGAYSCSWSPDGTKIAYATALIVPNADDKRTGIYIYDLKSKKKTLISREGDQVFWDPQDEKLYVAYDKRGRVLKYDPMTGISVDTPHLGDTFSPCGSYYYSSRDDVHCPIFRTSDDRNIVVPVLDGKSPPLCWLSDDIIRFRLHIGPKGARQERDLVFDCKEQVVYEVAGAAVAVVDNGEAVIVCDESGHLSKTRMDQLKKIDPQANPKDKDIPN